MVEAEDYLKYAAEVVQSYDGDKRKVQEMKARLLGNQGNLALDQGRLADAIGHYTESLKLFEGLEDQEHIGIAHLQLAQAFIRTGNFGAECNNHLEEAQKRFTVLGWIEGQARVLEQRALRAKYRSESTHNKAKKTSLLNSAISNAEQAWDLFDSIKHRLGEGRITALLNEWKRDLL